MSNKENRTLTIVKEDGSEVLCEILFTTYDENFKKNYVVFEVLDGEGEVSAAIYEPSDTAEGALSSIETDEEWDMIEKLLEKYIEEQEDEDSCGCGCGDSCGCESDDCECDHDHEEHSCGCCHNHE